jgi:ATP-dependent DNA ligase
VFRHVCNLGLEGIVSKRKGSPYRSGRSPDWLKVKNPTCEAVRREVEEEWVGEGQRPSVSSWSSGARWRGSRRRGRKALLSES